MKNLFPFFILFLLAAISCKDDPDPTIYPNYGNLAVGNYWIYQRITVDSNEVITTLNQFDSVYVEKDTLIGGHTYFKYMDKYHGGSPGYTAFWLRDSLHYIVSKSGEILFSSENFTDTLIQVCEFSHNTNDTIACIFTWMTNDGLIVSTPAGAFATKSLLTKHRLYYPASLYGVESQLHRRYAENVGVVFETQYAFISDPQFLYGRQLVRWGPQ